MKIGVIGCGYWGPNLVRNLVANESCEKVAICDLDMNRLNGIKRRFPGVELSNDPEAFLADESIDAVMIATPLTQHYPLARQALLNNKHVSPKLDTTEPLATEVDTFINSIKTGNAPPTDGWNGLEVVQVLEAAEALVQQGGAVVQVGTSLGLIEGAEAPSIRRVAG